MAVAQSSASALAGGIAVPANERVHAQPRRGVVGLLQRQPIGVLAALVLIIIALAGLLADVISPQDPATQLLRESLKPPGTVGQSGITYVLGTDSLGRDELSRVIHGARVSLMVGGFAVFVGTVGGLLIGMISGYRGGRLDMVIQ